MTCQAPSFHVSFVAKIFYIKDIILINKLTELYQKDVERLIHKGMAH